MADRARPAVIRTRYIRARWLAGLLVTAVIATMGMIGSAAAAEYPSWEDVLAAQTNEAAKQAEIQSLQGLIFALKADVAAAEKESARLGSEYEIAQNKYDTAQFRSSELRAQAEAASVVAHKSAQQAGRFAALLSKSGGSGLSMTLLLSDADDADTLLYQLGAMSKLTESTSVVNSQAEQDTNVAEALTDQADVAAGELESLADEAARLRDGAVVAQQKLEAALVAQQGKQAELEAQVAVLTENRTATEADYNAGLAARAAAEAAAEAARAAAAAEVPAGADKPVTAASGWSSPFPGSFSTDEYGMRVNPVDGGYRLHSGLDLAYNSGTCGAPVYAAAAGEVTFAGPNGSLGNNVQVAHGGGITTNYAHNTSIVVARGESVAAGQVIAYAGTTGNSTGCHVHFETRVGGDPQDPRSFMADRGVQFG